MSRKSAALPPAPASRIDQRHHQTGAVAEDADVALEPDVGEPGPPGAVFRTVRRREGRTGAAPESCVVVERDLGVHRDQSAGARLAVRSPHQAERVDLRERGVAAEVQLPQAADGLLQRSLEIALEAGGRGDAAYLIVPEPKEGIDRDADHALPVGGCSLLDVDSALGREKQDGPSGRPVQRDGQIELADKVQRFLEEQGGHRLAADVQAQDVLCDSGQVVGAADTPDAASLAPAAAEHLRLDDERVADVLRGGHGLGR